MKDAMSNRFRIAQIIALGFMFWLCHGQSSAQIVLRLNTHELPPYSFHNDQGQIDGIAIRVTECALKKVNQPYSIAFYPWARAQMLVQVRYADGFFAASASEERNQYAVLSATIAPQEWRWYLRNDNPMDPRSPTFKDVAMVGSFNGANMQDWLINNQYKVAANPPTNMHLLKMLQTRRLDAILANKLVMDALIAEGGGADEIRSVLLQDKPLGIYISKEVLANLAPDFMSRLNQAIAYCRKK